MNPSAWTTLTRRSTKTERHFRCRDVVCYENRPPNLNALVGDVADNFPDHEALVYKDVRLSYRQLVQHAAALADRLRQAGVKAGERVGVLLNNQPEFVIALLACWQTGAIGVPINVRLQRAELEYILSHCGATVLVYSDQVSDRLPDKSHLPLLRHYWPLSDCEDAASRHAHAACSESPDADAASRWHRANEDDVALILYTSGTTGKPKGAMLTHLGLIHAALQYVDAKALDLHERSVMAVPASHVTGITANILPMFCVAGCIVIMPQFNAQAFVELADRERVTHTVIVPAMYKLILLRVQVEQYDLHRWRIGGYGGAPMPRATIDELSERLPNLKIANIYGATESTGPCVMMPLGHTAAHADSVGRVLPCFDIKVMDAADKPSATNESGELWIKGPGVVPGYWLNEEANGTQFSDGYWRSGDVGLIDDAGYVYILDRLKDLVNRGGYKVYSIEVENVLNLHPDVIESAVVAKADDVLGEKIHAFVYSEAGEVSEEILREHCSQQLADYKVPDYVTIDDRPLPRNANGKLQKDKLRKR